MVIFFDHLVQLPREYKQAQLVYSGFNQKKTIIDARLVQITNAEPDFQNNGATSKVSFGAN